MLAHSPSIVLDGLVLCLDAGNPKSYPGSGTTWTDLSGNGNTGTLTNMDGGNLSSANGGSFTFDGTNEYISANISNFFTSYSQQITMEAWIYIPTSATWTNGFYGNIFTRGYFDGSHGLWRTTTNNQVAFYCRTIGAGTNVHSLATIARDTWYQLVGVWTGSGTQLYINGQLADSDSGSLGDTENNVPFEIGRNTAAGGADGNYFTGNQAGHKIYNRALTPQEIQQNYNALKGRFQ
jgi:hypothetical protein